MNRFDFKIPVLLFSAGAGAGAGVKGDDARGLEAMRRGII